MIITSTGSLGTNAGIITMFVNNVGGGGTIGTIGVGNIITAVGDSRTLWAHHYVALSKTASLATFIVSAISGGSGTNANFYLTSKDVLVANSTEIIESDLLLTVNTIVRTLGIPIRISGFKRVTAYGIPGVNNATLSASFDFAEQ
jgi:hypothetical protein